MTLSSESITWSLAGRFQGRFCLAVSDDKNFIAIPVNDPCSLDGQSWSSADVVRPVPEAPLLDLRFLFSVQHGQIGGCAARECLVKGVLVSMPFRGPSVSCHSVNVAQLDVLRIQAMIAHGFAPR